ncbi:hypothetical protein [Natronospora cellulosivora (SeqCode)]
MRKISFNEHDQKRKSSRVDLLEIRDSLDKKASSTLRKRDSEKRFLLYRLAKERKEKMIKKVGDRKYKFL